MSFWVENVGIDSGKGNGTAILEIWTLRKIDFFYIV